MFPQDVRGCIEQIQTIEREVESLEVSRKALGQLRDLLDAKRIEKSELQIRQEVSHSYISQIQTYVIDLASKRSTFPCNGQT